MISTYKKDFNGIDGFVSVEPYDYKNVAVVIWMHGGAMEHAYTYLENNKDMLGRCAKGAPDHRLVYASAIRGAGLIEKNTKIWYKGIFKGATCDQATSIQ